MSTSDHDPPWERVLTYWLGGPDQDRSHIWFAQSDDIDAEIRQRFGDLVEQAASGRLDHWAATARGRLALIILLDQFSRNLHRDSAAAFASDARAQALCLEGMDLGVDRELSLLERWFFYMPLEHAEDLALQERSVQAFAELARLAPAEQARMFESALDYARRHRDVIARFGRFPHRNQVLGRDSTPEEREYLAKGKRF